MDSDQQCHSTEFCSHSSFIEKFKREHGYVKFSFYTKGLETAINEADELEISTDSKYLIILYLHNDFDPFSKEFCKQLATCKELGATIEPENWYLVPWDITEEKICKALKRVVKKIFGYNIIFEKLSRQKSAVFIINTSINILENIDSTTSLKHFHFILKPMLNTICLKTQKSTEETDGDEEICARKFHQIMYEYLGDRDFDAFEYDEHEYLQNKIFFSIYGFPTSEEQDNGKNKTVNEIYELIRSTNNKYTKWDDNIVVSFIYTCIEPLGRKKFTTNMYPLPVFVVRKCRGSKTPCRYFIDLDLRVYTSWKRYLQRNRLPRCRMIVPQDGRYRSDTKRDVLLEQHRSPRCAKSGKILRYVDISVTILALISAFAMIASFIYPSMALPAGIVALLCAAYSITRSSMQIHDRRIHKQDMSIRNGEARSAYLNIIGNSIGIVGGALTRTVVIIAGRGIQVGKAIITTVNAVNYASLTTDFIGILNGITEFKKCKQGLPLQILQFAFSVLFFNNAIINLVKTKGLFVQSEISHSVKTSITRRNDHKPTGQTVSHLRSIHTENVMKTLTGLSSNPSMNKAIMFSNNGGHITLNDVSVNIMKQTMVQFKGLYLPPNQRIATIVQSQFLSNEEKVELYVEILDLFPPSAKDMIIELTKKFLHVLKEEQLQFDDTIKKMFPHSTYTCKILEIVVIFFEEKYSSSECTLKISQNNEEYRENFFKMIENSCNACNSTLIALTQFYLNWLTTAIYEYEHTVLKREKRRQMQGQYKIKIDCKQCNGYYYKNSKDRNYSAV